MSQPIVRRQPRDRHEIFANDVGLKGQNRRAVELGNGSAFAAQDLRGVLYSFQKGEVITNLGWFVNANGAAPANLNHAILALIDSTGAILGQSADDPATFRTTGRKLKAITGGPIEIQFERSLYVCCYLDQSAAGGLPTMLGNLSIGAVPVPAGTGLSEGVVQTATALSGGILTSPTWTASGREYWVGWS